MTKCVRRLLKEMQTKSSSVGDYMSFTEQYENYHFQELEEVEYEYLKLRKFYLGKVFSYELAYKLENNKLARPSFGQTVLRDHQTGGLT